jgi:branched-chain amino acid transport system permease protein
MFRSRADVVFWIVLVAVFLAGLGATYLVTNEYYFTALYGILQAMLMAVAWNILGGFTGYVNFGSAGFFALGAYTAVFLDKALGLPLPLLIVAAAVVCGLLGLGVGYLSLRLKGVYFAIATLATAIVLETLITNWRYVGGGRGAYLVAPAEVPFL